MTSSALLLELTEVRAGYGEFQALFDISLEVRTGEIVTLIGANGAGKTTTMRVISGAIRATSGTVRFDGHDVTGLPAHAMPERGISHVPEGRQLFPFMTVEENLGLGAYNPRSRPRARATLGEMLELFPRLQERRRQLAGTLSGGEQQMVAIARGLMAAPRLLLLDEPSLGLSPKIAEEVFARVQDIRKRGVTVLIVEQNVVDALSISDRGYVVEHGRVVLQGDAGTLLHDEKVRAAYLGL
ncbi:MAG TPA: ABC transporter ATP-binding protein [Kofleriaceae bacterium]|jgi:branched-chain amino acid transport system ATP-binding protein|nr:ABC transporter ATP-binding protein [Kofleriaceae bacterium]